MALTFKGIEDTGFGGYSLTDQLLFNIKNWINWGLLHHGAFESVMLDDVSFYADDESILKPSPHDTFVEGIVWEGAGREWVWESGVVVPSGMVEPFRVSGIEFDGTFLPLDTVGAKSYHVDYRHGRILFDQPQSSDSEIRVEYTKREVFVDSADTLEFRTLMLNAVEEFRTDDAPDITPVREHQAWLPAIFVDIRDGRQRGLQLGGGQIKTRIITLHIFADNPGDRNLLMDWLDFQSRAAFFMADLNDITFPFDEFGDIVDGVTNWVDMTTDAPYKKLRILDGTSTKIDAINTQLFRARVRWEAELDFGQI